MIKRIFFVIFFAIYCEGSHSLNLASDIKSYDITAAHEQKQEMIRPKIIAMEVKQRTFESAIQPTLDQLVVPEESFSFDLEAIKLQVQQSLSGALECVVKAAKESKEEELNRLWLQSYNAGPGALLKYKGKVPYRETRTYVKKVSEYYKQDLSENPYDNQIQEAAQKFNLDPQMIRAIAKAESNFNPRCVSHAGARGVMQVMNCTWAHAKKVTSIPWSYGKDVFNPDKNIYVACAYLSWLKHDFIPQNMNKLHFRSETTESKVQKSSSTRKRSKKSKRYN